MADWPWNEIAQWALLVYALGSLPSSKARRAIAAALSTLQKHNHEMAQRIESLDSEIADLESQILDMDTRPRDY